MTESFPARIIAAAADVFGYEGVGLITSGKIVFEWLPEGSEEASQAHAPGPEDGRPAKMLLRRGPLDLFVAIHEFAHCYHAVEWPELTAEVPAYRAEACALEAEARLVLARQPGILPEWRAREARVALAARASTNVTQAIRVWTRVESARHIRDAMEAILKGHYDDEVYRNASRA